MCYDHEFRRPWETICEIDLDIGCLDLNTKFRIFSLKDFMNLHDFKVFK